MSNTIARYWKCALQVNTNSYQETFRGQKGQYATIGEYDDAVVNYAKEGNIAVVGLANHHDFNEEFALKKKLEEAGVVVFPGFEVMCGKSHYVCLFSETTTAAILYQVYGRLHCKDNEDSSVTSLGVEEFLKAVHESAGFVYAAHCTEDNGAVLNKDKFAILSPYLSALQIPGDLDSIKNGKGVDCASLRIVLNKDPAYHRDKPLAIINAKDVADPKDILLSHASCLIKMTKPSFQAFKEAFCDPDSRVRLNSDVAKQYNSVIEKVEVVGGFLDGLSLSMSENLNVIIGGKGTGKSTLLECIRFAFDLPISDPIIRKNHNDMIKANLGNAGGQVKVLIRSGERQCERFIVSRKYGETTVIRNATDNTVSAYTVQDLIPELKVYGQSEIFNVAQNKASQRELIEKLIFGREANKSQGAIEDLNRKLTENRGQILGVLKKIDNLETTALEAKQIEEEINAFNKNGIGVLLKEIPLLEKKKNYIASIDAEWSSLSDYLESFEDDVSGLDDLNVPEGISEEDKKSLSELVGDFTGYKGKVTESLQSLRQLFMKAKAGYETKRNRVLQQIKSAEEKMSGTFSSIPSSTGKTGVEIATKYTSLVSQYEKIKSSETQMKNAKVLLGQFRDKRKDLLAELGDLVAEHHADKSTKIKKLNKKLDTQLSIELLPESDRSVLTAYLDNCKLPGLGVAKLNQIENASYSPKMLADVLGNESRSDFPSDWGVTSSVAEAFRRLTEEQRMQLEEMVLPDVVGIKLNVSHKEGELSFKSIEELSPGQKCTAILHLLLLENTDPLIIDQPEDNLDNAFIADRIVPVLRSQKITRQFLFASHNPNIPIFGDAEMIGVFDSDAEHGMIPEASQGGIDTPAIKEKAAEILDGGKTAFLEREEKYGFKKDD